MKLPPLPSAKGVSVAAHVRGQHAQPAPGGHGLETLATQPGAVVEGQLAAGAVMAAVAAAGGMVDAVEGGEDLEAAAVRALDLNDLAEPAAVAAGAARVGAKLLAPQRERCL